MSAPGGIEPNEDIWVFLDERGVVGVIKDYDFTLYKGNKEEGQKDIPNHIFYFITRNNNINTLHCKGV